MSWQEREALKPCPFCGQEIEARWSGFNPRAACGTGDCFGARLPVINLDDPTAVAAWNTRAAQPEADSEEEAELRALNAELADILTRTANALRGEPAPLSLHSWHDLPERVSAALVAIEVMQQVAINLAAQPAAPAVPRRLSREEIGDMLLPECRYSAEMHDFARGVMDAMLAAPDCGEKGAAGNPVTVPARPADCSQALREAGKPYPRTCASCGLGPCKGGV